MLFKYQDQPGTDSMFLEFCVKKACQGRGLNINVVGRELKGYRALAMVNQQQNGYAQANHTIS